VFATVVRGPAGVIDGLGPIILGSGFWDLAPPASRLACIVAAPPRLGYEGPLDPREPLLPWAFPLSGLASVEPRITTSGSNPLLGFVFAANGVLRNGL